MSSTNVIQSPKLQHHDLMDHSFYMAFPGAFHNDWYTVGV